jgi:hypothetical protein
MDEGMERLIGVYVSKRKEIPVTPCGFGKGMVFTSGRTWPNSVCGKFIVRKAFDIGLVHIDDARGKWAVSVDALAPQINPMLEKGKIKQLPITPENEALVFPKKKAKR